jgi:hypothetical protein
MNVAEVGVDDELAVGPVGIFVGKSGTATPYPVG